MVLMMNEWKTEPNLKFGEYRNHKWMILRNHTMGHLCGYINVHENTQYYGCGYDKVPARFIECHGGMTFSGTFKYNFLKERYPEIDNKFIKNNDWWYGYDCAHFDDLTPLRGIDISGTYRNMDYCESECKAMIDQIHNIKLRKYYVDVSDKCWSESQLFVEWASNNLKNGEYNSSNGYFATDDGDECMLIKLSLM
jgi:hypothetical protein